MIRARGTLLLFVTITCLPIMFLADTASQRQIGRIGESANFVAVIANGKWGLAVTGAGMASVVQPEPVAFEFFEAPGKIHQQSSGYERLDISAAGAVGVAQVAGPGNTRFTVEDRWSIKGNEIQLLRNVAVAGNANLGFLSAITFVHPEAHPRSEVDYFAPGMIYGSTQHLSAAAIGGSATYGAEGHGEIQIREDRLPAPLFGVHYSDGSALTVLDASPNGATTRADSQDTDAHTIVDEGLKFGALGVHLADGHHEQGYWFPGSEGEATYGGNTYPDGSHAWRRRYHPIRNGLTQQYRVQFRFSSGEQFPEYYRHAWRWAYGELRPPVTWQNLGRSSREALSTCWQAKLKQLATVQAFPISYPRCPTESLRPISTQSWVSPARIWSRRNFCWRTLKLTMTRRGRRATAN